MSTNKKQTTANNSPATPCPVKDGALAGLVLLRAFLMPVIEVIYGLCFCLLVLLLVIPNEVRGGICLRSMAKREISRYRSK